ncbi:MAG: glutamate formimidoyltransferase [Calditrichaeota bacterium]|nr:MAG: glutamate formimidoyltransferase [Calditrichota bacterium]
MKLIECVPNFSEGRDLNVINQITAKITEIDGVKLLDVDPGNATNRTVVTFVGEPNAVVEAAFQAIKKASEVIDLAKHSGAHARMGATDVCPLIPISGVTTEECIELSEKLAKRVGEELEIPVYLYEKSAKSPERTNLAKIRAGEYEALPEKLKKPEWKPDFGPAKFHSRAGATVIGVREFLIAYNINLNTRSEAKAHDIAKGIREKGRWARDEKGNFVFDENGKHVFAPGIFKELKGVGWYIDEYGVAQLSMNFTNYKITSIHAVFDEVCRQAEKRGLRVTGSELVGLIPKDAILAAGNHYLAKQGSSLGVSEEELIHIAIKSLGLDELTEFDPDKKIIEFMVFPRKGNLVKMDLREFANETASDSVAPGGGSISALAGSLGAALGTMVANLTFVKKEFKANRPRLNELAVKGQTLKDELLQLVDKDTDAFNQIIAAIRLPKSTADEKATRLKGIENATKNAILVPLRVMETCFSALEICEEMARNGNKSSVSDAGVGALVAKAGLEGAFLNVQINLKDLKDADFENEVMTKAKELSAKANILQDKTLATVKQHI